jgi:adenylate cyclase
MSGVIMRHGGYINKYIGDGIMALFGAPLGSATHAADAARAAAGCREELARLNAAIVAAGKPAIRIRIGISTGEVVVGLVGALGKKLEYTAMGDIVNLGARLEAASKAYKTTVLMSGPCHEQCREAVVAREIDLFRVPGKAVPVRAYELLGMRESPGAEDAFLAAYEDGMSHYKAREWEAAEASFRRALEMKPEDGPSRIYVERCAAFRAKPPATDWDGVWDVTVK